MDGLSRGNTMKPENMKLADKARRKKKEQWGPRVEKALTYAVDFLEKTNEPVTARSLWKFFSDKVYRKEVLRRCNRERLWGPGLPKSAMRIAEEGLWKLQDPLRKAVDEATQE
ncbi:hypothetical protein AKJ62_03620 [candidate division MSBL1 archaeon SCGC-AAA259D14]|uniref:Uncharacterized protein n=1 Tax=candidate division MSBL1 archaeon SCGC-AAA259D14 TaxID=1698261 RepID=A0A133U4R6_9EURY|nr:hypothetical protein AKJ62_03620 [candidate division MSBL1 archaeon SCGC-AAA259D14]